MSELSPVHSDVDRTGRRALVVLGMHRSGTSAMTKTLALLGAKLPKRLMPATESNPAGHWEPQDVANLNDEILQALDSEWDDVFASRPREYLSNFDRYYLGRAVELVQDDFNGSELIVLKDPRIAVLTPFWDRALREAGYTTHYVIMVRNPLEVAESLRTRDSFPREKSLLLWSSYMIAADRDTRDKDRIFISYDQLLTDWRAVRNRIERSAGIPFPRNTTTAANEIDRHLDDRLRHHRAAAEDVVSRSDVPEEVQILYRIFLGACEGAEIDRSKVDEIHAELSKMDSFVGPLLADYRSRVRTLAQDMTELSNAHACARDRAELLEEQLRADQELREAEAHAASETNAEYERRVAELSEQITAMEVEKDRLATEVDGQRRQQLAICDSLQKEIDGLTAELRQQGVAAVAARDELTARIAASEAERDRLAIELEAMTRNATEFAEQLEKAEVERNRLIEEVEGKARAAAELRESLGVMKAHFAGKEAELKTARDLVSSTKAELAGNEDRLAQRFQELATLTNLLRHQEQRSEEVEEQISWLIAVNERLSTEPRWWSLMPRRWRRRWTRRCIQEAGLFDGDAYLRRHADVAAAGADPLEHYLKHGLKEGRPL
jgi:hypothetical protein